MPGNNTLTSTVHLSSCILSGETVAVITNLQIVCANSFIHTLNTVLCMASWSICPSVKLCNLCIRQSSHICTCLVTAPDVLQSEKTSARNVASHLTKSDYCLCARTHLQALRHTHISYIRTHAHWQPAHQRETFLNQSITDTKHSRSNSEQEEDILSTGSSSVTTLFSFVYSLLIHCCFVNA